MKSTKGEQSKKYLIEIAAKLFLRKGYSNTGISDILREADMSKGSFYFYFSSKEELALEVAKYYGKTVLIKWLKPLSNNSWNVFVKNMICDIKGSVSSGNYFGCPIAVLGLDISFIENNLPNPYTNGINGIIAIFSNSLQISGLAKDKADMAARKAFAIYEGYVLYYRISKDKSAFDYMLKDLLPLNNG